MRRRGIPGMPDTILVVDDNPVFLRVTGAMLAKELPDVQVRTASTGTGALSALANTSPLPRAILLDFHLPDLDAPAVLERLRAIPQYAEIPVLVLTQANWQVDTTTALGAGATAMTPKPSRVDALASLVVGFWRQYVEAT